MQARREWSEIFEVLREKITSLEFCTLQNYPSKVKERDFPGGAVVKKPPAYVGDRGSIPAPGRSHMPWSN